MTTDLKPYFKVLIDLYLDYPVLKSTDIKPLLATRLIIACQPEDFTYVNVNWLARVLEVDVSSFSKLYKRHYGKTIQESIISRKVWWAARLLDEHPEMSISECAEKLDYCDANYFIKVFKKEKGITPLQYKIKMRNQPPEIKKKNRPSNRVKKKALKWFQTYDLIMGIRKINIRRLHKILENRGVNGKKVIEKWEKK